jgi:hypothetical protein
MAEQQHDADEQRIRARIEQRRIRMGATIEEVGAHLNPDHLKHEFRTGVREQVEQTKRELRSATIGRAETLMTDMEESVNRTSRTLMETIRDNPVPAAMAGIGLGWMIVDARRHHTYDSYDFEHRSSGRGNDPDARGYGRYGSGYERYGREYDRYGAASTESGYEGQYRARTVPGGYVEGTRGLRNDETAEHMGGDRDIVERGREKVTEVADQARETVERVQETISDSADWTRRRASKMTHRVGDAWHEAEDRARRTRSEVRHLSEENPLAAGAVALALGFAAGMMVPETSRERHWMGAARDRVVDRVQKAAGDTMEKVGQVAEATADAARETAEREAGRQGLIDDAASTGDEFSGRL